MAAADLEVYEAPADQTFDGKVAGPPSLEDEVADGALPPASERVPAIPCVVPSTEQRANGRHGGELTTLVTRTKDSRLLVVYGYARLIGYDEAFNLVPDILQRVEVENGRIFTFTLREGHRWSDGEPFTTEDFRYYWEDMANNEELSPTGPSVMLRVDGELPKVEILDERRVRYSWSKPNPFLLPALAGARPLFLYAPSHFLKKYHEDYGDPEFIAREVKRNQVRNWAQLHNRMDDLYKFDEPALPTLQPWTLVTGPPSMRMVAERNPFYHRIDEEGRQLPYIDRVILNVVGTQLVPAKTGAGESDLQARGLQFSDYTFLKESESRSSYDVRLWKTVRGSQIALYPNLNTNDPVWREIMRDVRFRRALSLGVDRHEINQVIYYGLTLEGNNTVLPGSPLYEEHYRTDWAQYDPELANKLLDEIGLAKRNSEGTRLLPDGRPLEIVVESAGENIEEIDVLELIRDTWKDLGIKLFIKPSQREVLRKRIFAGETKMAVWFGYENGIPTADMDPREFVPLRQHSYHWPKWGQYAETGGAAGKPVDMEKPKKLLELYEDWRNARSKKERRKAWDRILEIHADQIFTIGTVAQVPQPVVVKKGLRNVPEKEIFNWDPGAQFGVYRTDSFWFEK